MEWNQMIPEFDVFDLKESLHFYIDLIGFHVEYDRKENKFAFLQLEKVQIMIQEIDKENNKWGTGKLEYPLGVGINFQIDVTNIDEIYGRLKEAKYQIFVEMEDHWYRKDDVLMGWNVTVCDHNSHSIYWNERQKDGCYFYTHNKE